MTLIPAIIMLQTQTPNHVPGILDQKTLIGVHCLWKLNPMMFLMCALFAIIYQDKKW